jgi:hypothetical protein
MTPLVLTRFCNVIGFNATKVKFVKHIRYLTIIVYKKIILEINFIYNKFVAGY